MNTDPDTDFYNGDETLAATKSGLDGTWPPTTPTDKAEQSHSETEIGAAPADEADPFEELSPNGRVCPLCQRTAKYFHGDICGNCAVKMYSEELQNLLSPSRHYGEDEWLQDRDYVGSLLDALVSSGFTFEIRDGQFWVEPQPTGQVDLELRIYGHAILRYITEVGHGHWPPLRRSSDEYP